MTARRRLLLLSNSTQPGHGFLEHCAVGLRSHYAGCGTVLFVPYAGFDLDGYADKAIEAFDRIGIQCRSIHREDDQVTAATEAGGFFVGGGNTFRLVRALRERGLLEVIRSRVLDDGTPYAGASAGSNIACPTIRTTNDMPIVEPGGFDALNLVPFQINPHYLDADPTSRHMGETRPQRIFEYLEENARPVVGLREGAWLAIDGDRMTLQGLAGARLFARGADGKPAEPVEYEPGADLGFLLQAAPAGA